MELDAWLASSPNNKLLFEEIDNEELFVRDVELMHPENWQQIEQRMRSVISRSRHSASPIGIKGRRTFMHRWGSVAAAVLVLAGIAGAFLVVPSSKVDKEINGSVVIDLPPGRNGAVLTLADGTEVVLDSFQNGDVATQMGAHIVLNDGRLSYNTTGDALGESGYNTMRTPKGRCFHIVLHDGTQVWLNAASSIRYPTMFNGTERRVEVSGEVFMEVAKNSTQPFIVTVDDGQQIEVLGTSFNINAYKDESGVITTLIDGAINVRKNNKQALLKPMQQLTVREENGSTNFLVETSKDINKTLAWRSGLFNFEGASLQDVMKEIGRWYDLQIVFETGAPKLEFGGELDRNVPLSVVLKALEKNGVNVSYDPNERQLKVLSAKRKLH